jgi:GH25 family lysozyme M1 (1,4-beta-N-acetylmuramidase)
MTLPETTYMPSSATFSLADRLYLATEGWKLDGVTNIIDISWWQDPALIDYDALAGIIDGCILRSAYATWVDRRFEIHYRELHDRGVLLGCYHYITGDQSPVAQVNTLKAAISGYDLPLGMWCDVEDTRSGTGLYRGLVDAYLDKADEQLGQQEIYTSMSKWDTIMRVGYHNHRKLWVAHYTSAPNPLMPRTGNWDSYWLHQFTSKARLDGYDRGGLDNSRYNGSEIEWYSQFGMTPPPSEEPTAEELQSALASACDIIEAKAHSDSAWAANALLEVEGLRKWL